MSLLKSVQALKDKLSAKQQQDGSAAPPAGFRRLAALNKAEWMYGVLGLLCAAAVGLQVSLGRALRRCSVRCCLHSHACMCGSIVATGMSFRTSGHCLPGCLACLASLCRCLAFRLRCPRWFLTCGSPTPQTSGEC